MKCDEKKRKYIHDGISYDVNFYIVAKAYENKRRKVMIY